MSGAGQPELNHRAWPLLQQSMLNMHHQSDSCIAQLQLCCGTMLYLLKMKRLGHLDLQDTRLAYLCRAAIIKSSSPYSSAHRRGQGCQCIVISHPPFYRGSSYMLFNRGGLKHWKAVDEHYIVCLYVIIHQDFCASVQVCNLFICPDGI